MGLTAVPRHRERFAALVVANTWEWPVNGDVHFEVFPGSWVVRWGGC